MIGNNGQANRCRATKMRLSSKSTAYLVRQSSKTNDRCNATLSSIRYQAEAQPFRSHQAQEGQGSLPPFLHVDPQFMPKYVDSTMLSATFLCSITLCAGEKAVSGN
jgi:hypothetical protein